MTGEKKLQIIRIILAVLFLATGTLFVVMAILGFFSEAKFEAMEYVIILGISGNF